MRTKKLDSHFVREFVSGTHQGSNCFDGMESIGELSVFQDDGTQRFGSFGDMQDVYYEEEILSDSENGDNSYYSEHTIDEEEYKVYIDGFEQHKIESFVEWQNSKHCPQHFFEDASYDEITIDSEEFSLSMSKVDDKKDWTGQKLNIETSPGKKSKKKKSKRIVESKKRKKSKKSKKVSKDLNKSLSSSSDGAKKSRNKTIRTKFTKNYSESDSSASDARRQPHRKPVDTLVDPRISAQNNVGKKKHSERTRKVTSIEKLGDETLQKKKAKKKERSKSMGKLDIEKRKKSKKKERSRSMGKLDIEKLQRSKKKERSKSMGKLDIEKLKSSSYSKSIRRSSERPKSKSLVAEEIASPQVKFQRKSGKVSSNRLPLKSPTDRRKSALENLDNLKRQLEALDNSPALASPSSAGRSRRSAHSKKSAIREAEISEQENPFMFKKAKSLVIENSFDPFGLSAISSDDDDLSSSFVTSDGGSMTLNSGLTAKRSSHKFRQMGSPSKIVRKASSDLSNCTLPTVDTVISGGEIQW
jgi:hypothetical protein